MPRKTKKQKKDESGINPPPDHETPAIAETAPATKRKAIPVAEIRAEISNRTHGSWQIPAVLSQILAERGISMKEWRDAIKKK